MDDFRRVCILRRAGKYDDAQRVLDQELPASIAAWSRDEKGNATDKKVRLQQMFEFERRRLEDSWAMEQVIRDKVKAELLTELKIALAADFHQQARVWFEEWTKASAANRMAEKNPSPAVMVPLVFPENPVPSSTDGNPPIVWQPTLHPGLEPEHAEISPRQDVNSISDRNVVFPSGPPDSPMKFCTAPSAGTSRPGFDDVAGALDWILSEQNEWAQEISAGAVVGREDVSGMKPGWVG